MATQYWNGSAWVTPAMKVYDGSGWADVGGGGGLESVQRGSQYIAGVDGSSNSIDITINSVDLNQSYVTVTQRSVTNTIEHAMFVYGELINSTTLRITMGDKNSSVTYDLQVEWQVVELKGLERVQSGTTSTGSSTTDTATFNAVDLSKTVLIIHYGTIYDYGTIGPRDFVSSARFVNNTTLEFERQDGDVGLIWSWFLLEYS